MAAAALMGPASCQIFGGVSETGSVILSDTRMAEAPALIVAAPLVAAAALPVKGQARAATVPAVFLPLIAEASLASRLPVALIHAVIAVESNYRPRAVSARGARGLMQIMPDTARRFGSGDPFDPRQNILAGSRYLRWLLDHFDQDIELAVAAYNAGEGAVQKAGGRIPPFAETLAYVPRVLARYRQALPDGAAARP